MAYYLAEKISASRQSTGDDRARLESEACDVILRLWASRHNYPNGVRPLENIETTIQLLNSLSKEDAFARYFASPRQSGRAGLAEDDAQAKTWLDIADFVDDAARAIILYCLSAAVQSSKNEAADWLELVTAVGLGDEAELPVVRILIARSGIAAEDAAEVAERKGITDLLKRLRGLEKSAQVIALELEKKLARVASDGKGATVPPILSEDGE